MGNMAYDALNQYKQNAVFTATPEELTLMLYDGAIKFINIAKLNIEKGDVVKAHEAIIRAEDIVIELNASLNMDYEISKNLRSIYDFMMEKLVDGNIKKEVKPLDEALELLTDLRDTWKEAIKQVKKTRYSAK
jgi:flagellar secretion chaperone FliS